MKGIPVWLYLFTVTLFVQCTVTKRHYQSGYDVRWHKQKRSAEATNDMNAAKTRETDSNVVFFFKEKSKECLQDTLVLEEAHFAQKITKTTPKKEKSEKKATTKQWKKNVVSTENSLDFPPDKEAKQREREIPLVLGILLLIPFIAFSVWVLIIAFLIDSLLGVGISIALMALAGLILWFGFLNIFNRKETKEKLKKGQRNTIYVFLAIALTGLQIWGMYLLFGNL